MFFVKIFMMIYDVFCKEFYDDFGDDYIDFHGHGDMTFSDDSIGALKAFDDYLGELARICENFEENKEFVQHFTSKQPSKVYTPRIQTCMR